MLTVFNNANKEFKSFIKYLSYCVKCNITQAVSNKKSFVIQTIFMFLNNLIWLAFWFILLYNSGGNINGVKLNDIIYLWSAPTLSFGLCLFIFGGVEDISRMVANKEIDSVIVKPKHSLISLITSSSKLSAMGDLIYGLVLGIWAVNFNPLRYIWFIIISCIGAVGFLGIMIFVESLSFWLGDISRSARIYSMTLLLTFTIYPENMFTGILKIAMYTVIPAMYIAHVPIRIIKHFDIKLLLFELIIISLMMVISVVTYNRGLKRYGK